VCVPRGKPRGSREAAKKFATRVREFAHFAASRESVFF